MSYSLTASLTVPSCLAAAAVVFGFAATADAGGVPWDPPSGSAMTFDYEDGCNAVGLFGDPALDGDTLRFAPSDFLSSSDSQNSTGPVSDTASFIATANDGLFIDAVRFAFLGDYAILGEGSVLANAMLRVTDLDGNGSVSAPVSASFDTGSANFDFDGEVALPGQWSRVLIELEGGLTAESESQSLAIGQFKSAGVEVSTAGVPLPPALLAAIPAGFVALRARKKLTRQR